MTHTEEIQVWIYTKERNSSGGYVPGIPVRQTLAPTWATIQGVSGNDTTVNTRNATLSVFDITVNYRPGFSWERIMFITSRFGNLDITNIYEDRRKRTIKLTGERVEGVTNTAGGQIMTLYRNATYGETSILIPELEGATVLLAFRDGINKEVLTSDLSSQNQMKYLTGTGTFELYPGDIFGDELITVLYRA